MEPDNQENNPTETTKIEIAASKLKKYQYAIFGLVGLILLVFIVLFFLTPKPPTDNVQDNLSESVQEATEIDSSMSKKSLEQMLQNPSNTLRVCETQDELTCFGSGRQLASDLESETYQVYALVSNDKAASYGLKDKETGELSVLTVVSQEEKPWHTTGRNYSSGELTYWTGDIPNDLEASFENCDHQYLTDEMKTWEVGEKYGDFTYLGYQCGTHLSFYFSGTTTISGYTDGLHEMSGTPGSFVLSQESRSKFPKGMITDYSDKEITRLRGDVEYATVFGSPYSKVKPRIYSTSTITGVRHYVLGGWRGGTAAFTDVVVDEVLATSSIRMGDSAKNVLEEYDFTYKGQEGKLTHKCVIENGDIYFKPERPERYVEKFPGDKGYCAQGGTLELTIAGESKVIDEYKVEKQTDHKKIEALSFSSGKFGASDGSYTHSTSSENSNHRLLIGFYHQPCRWDGAGGVCFSGESLSHIVRLPYPQNSGFDLEVTTISPPLFIFRGYKGLKWNMDGTKFVVRDAANDPVPSFRVYELGRTEPLFEYVIDYPNADQELIEQAWDDEMVEWRGSKVQILDTVFDTETGEESPAWLNIYAIEQYEPITINGVIYLPEDSSGPAHNPNRFSYDKSKFIAQAQNFSLAAGTFEIYPAAGNNFGYHYLRLGNEVFGMQFTGLGAVALVQFDDMDYPAFEDIGNGYSTDGERIYYVSNPEPLIGTNPSGYEFLELEAVREPVLIVGNIMLHRGKILEGLDYSTLHIGNTDMKPEGYYLSDSDNTIFIQKVQCHVGSYYETATLDDVANWVPGC